MTSQQFPNLHRAKDFVTRHQVFAYFVLAFAFSWTIWFFLPSLNNTGVFGPPVAAVIISAFVASERVNGSSRRRWTLFVLVFAAALAIWTTLTPGLDTQHTYPDWFSLWFPGAVSSAVIAFILSGPLAARRGVRDLLAPLAQLRNGWLWYLGALLLGPALWLLPVGLDLVLGGQLPSWLRGVPTPGLVASAFIWIVLFGGGLEEPGWRGFALPRLQSRWSPLVASLILGFLWASWHDPEYFTTPGQWDGPGAFAGIFFRLVWNVPLAIIFTWFYNRSGRSGLLAVILLHTSFNTTNALVPMSFQAGALMMGTMWAIAVLMILVSRMWHKAKAGLPGRSTSSGVSPKPQPIVA